MNGLFVELPAKKAEIHKVRNSTKPAVISGWETPKSALRRQKRIDDLYAKIGQLTVERDFLVVRSGR